MLIKEVTIEWSVTQNLGNYSSAKAGCTLTATVSTVDDVEEVKAELLAQAKRQVEEAIRAEVERRGL